MEPSPPPAILAASCDLVQLGLDPQDVASVEVICRRRINTVYRIRVAGQWHVLKWIERPEMSVEPLAYRLLRQHGVPLLPHRIADRVLLLEDLAHSDTWRLAEEVDMEREETGSAIAAWYRRFHEAGRHLLWADGCLLNALQCEAEKVTPANVRCLAARLGLPESAIQTAAEQVEPIVQAIGRQPRTLNYNDFHWSNLALSKASLPQAIVFDYHLLGVGMAYSDCRNVATCLRGRARDAFFEAYGPISEAERVLDAPIATLHALLQAAESPRLPTWANELMAQVRDGTLERQLHQAIAATQELAWLKGQRRVE